MFAYQRALERGLGLSFSLPPPPPPSLFPRGETFKSRHSSRCLPAHAGESDGCTEVLPDGTTCGRFDPMCATVDAIGSKPGEPRAPYAGDWFDYQVRLLTRTSTYAPLLGRLVRLPGTRTYAHAEDPTYSSYLDRSAIVVHGVGGLMYEADPPAAPLRSPLRLASSACR